MVVGNSLHRHHQLTAFAWSSTIALRNLCQPSFLNVAFCVFCLGFQTQRFFQFKAVQFCKPRLVRLGPARRHKAIVPDQKSDTDHWKGGVEIKSDFEENDEDLADFLKANTAFILQMSSTNAFTVPLFNGMVLFALCFLLDGPLWG